MFLEELGDSCINFAHRGNASLPFGGSGVDFSETIVIIGIICIPMGLAIAYASLLPALVGPLNPQYITVVAALFVIDLVFYFVSYAIQKSRGIPVYQMHRMIPSE